MEDWDAMMMSSMLDLTMQQWMWQENGPGGEWPEENPFPDIPWPFPFPMPEIPWPPEEETEDEVTEVFTLEWTDDGVDYFCTSYSDGNVAQGTRDGNGSPNITNPYSCPNYPGS